MVTGSALGLTIAYTQAFCLRRKQHITHTTLRISHTVSLVVYAQTVHVLLRFDIKQLSSYPAIEVISCVFVPHSHRLGVEGLGGALR
jgi:hypothetical protein